MPTGGWGYRWWGDPDRGAGVRQHGGWGYNVLPYVEETALYSIGTGLDEQGDAKKTAIAQRIMGAVLPVFNCPSRRSPGTYPFLFGGYPINAPGVTKTPKLDYCVNVGDRGRHTDPGPTTQSQGDDPSFVDMVRNNQINTGVVYQLSQVRLADITDGTTHTYLLCERNTNPDSYYRGNGPDDDGVSVGFDNDGGRTAGVSPFPDTLGVNSEDAFGAAHTTQWQGTMCDGSVFSRSYAITLELNQALGNRDDGQVVPE